MCVGTLARRGLVQVKQVQQVQQVKHVTEVSKGVAGEPVWFELMFGKDVLDGDSNTLHPRIYTHAYIQTHTHTYIHKYFQRDERKAQRRHVHNIYIVSL